MEVLKQKQYAPLSVAEIALSWFAAEKGYLDDVELKKIRSFNETLLSYLRDQYQSLLNEINAKPELTDAVSTKMREAIEQFKKRRPTNHGANQRN